MHYGQLDNIVNYNEVLADSSNLKKMWDNIILIVNKRRQSSNIEKLQHHGKQYHQPFSISNVLNKYLNLKSTYFASMNPPIITPLLMVSGPESP